jgi:mannose-6-phosphate isomerase-like protein (cupin superfamily)
MPIKVVDLKEMARQPKPKRQVLINGPRLHAWFHPYLEPGQKDEMHCHNQDQTFICLEGECTMRFLDGSKEVLGPNMVAVITGGSFYQLENTGSGQMVLMGCRSGSVEDTQTISHATRKELYPKTGPSPKGTKILV